KDTVTVTPVINPSVDKGTVPATGGVAITNVFANDSTNGVPSTIINSVISQSGTWPTGITLNTSTGAITVAGGTTPGVYPVTYQLCDKLVPANCATVKDTVTVTPLIKPITENGIVTSLGGVAINNVLSNDSTNGIPSTISNSVITQSGTWPTGITLNTSTGAITVAFGTALGVYPIIYQLCDKLVPANCATIRDTITVTSRLMNLSVSKTSSATYVAAGDSISYTIKVTNNGPSSLLSGEIITIIDQPAAGLTIGSYATTNGTYNSSNSALTLNSNFTTGQFVTLSVKGRVALPYLLDSIANTVLVRLPGDITNTGDSTSHIVVDVHSMIDAVDDDFTNDSTDGAKGGVAGNVLLNDLLNGSPISNPTKVSITLLNNGGLSGASISASGNVIVPAGAWEGSYILNYRICDSTNCDSATVLVRVKRGLMITATPKCINDVPYVFYKVTPNFNPNGTTPVTLTWLNGNGTSLTALSPITNSKLEDSILFAGTKPDAFGNPTSWPGWCFENGVWRQCDDGFLGVRPTAKLVVSVNPKDTISFTYPPATPACNALPPAVSRMAVRKRVTSTGTYQNVGDTILYAIVVENTGNVKLKSIQVIDSNATFISPPTGLIDSLNIGDSITITALHIITLADLLAKTVKNTAYTEGKDTGNVVIHGKSDSVITHMGRVVNLTVNKTATDTNVVAGDSLTYTITIRNNGVSSLMSGEVVTITDQPAIGLTIGSYTPSTGTYDVTTGTLTLNNTFTQGQSIILTVRAKVAASYSEDSIGNAVLVKLPGDVFHTGDSTDTVYISTTRLIDLSIQKTADRTLGHPTDTITYTIVVKNNGAGKLYKNETLTIHEFLPDSLKQVIFTATSPAGSSYNDTTGLYTLGDTLASGDSLILTVKGLIDPAFTGDTLINCVKVILPVDIKDTNTVNDSTWIITPIRLYTSPFDLIATDQIICKGNPTHMFVSSTGISNPVYSWYIDSMLVTKIGTGPSFDTMILNTTTFFITAKGDNKSENAPGTAKKIIMTVHDYASDTMIITNDTAVCYGRPATLIAAPHGPITDPVFTWYALPSLTIPIASGDTFNTSGLTGDTLYYVTIKGSNFCESRELHIVRVTILRNCGNARLGLAKALSKSTLQPDGSFDLTFNFVGGNFGDEDIRDVRMKDDLKPVFPNAQIKVVSLTTLGNWNINKNYDGVNDIEMLDTGNLLAIGQRENLILSVNIKFADDDTTTIFKNVAELRGQSVVNGNPITRKSQDGSNPDPDVASGIDSTSPTPIVINRNKPKQPLSVFIPDGFSPNKDNVHDFFVIENPDGYSIYFAVYNRWGNLIYEKDNYDNSWDGIAQKGIIIGDGEGVPDGTYFYIVEYTDANGKRQKFAHSLTIAR
ncbi:MAG: gliding motility-associated C-terminal domain-containing protein, partial [Bacteroidota bacterium]